MYKPRYNLNKDGKPSTNPTAALVPRGALKILPHILKKHKPKKKK